MYTVVHAYYQAVGHCTDSWLVGISCSNWRPSSSTVSYLNFLIFVVAEDNLGWSPRNVLDLDTLVRWEDLPNETLHLPELQWRTLVCTIICTPTFGSEFNRHPPHDYNTSDTLHFRVTTPKEASIFHIPQSSLLWCPVEEQSSHPGPTRGQRHPTVETQRETLS